jgi:DNA repair protein RecO (recombination protein O)
MQEGNFCSQSPDHLYYFSLPLSEKFSNALETSISGYRVNITDQATRAELLDKMLIYYRLHIPTFGEIKSVKVLTEVLKD